MCSVGDTGEKKKVPVIEERKGQRFVWKAGKFSSRPKVNSSESRISGRSDAQAGEIEDLSAQLQVLIWESFTWKVTKKYQDSQIRRD